MGNRFHEIRDPIHGFIKLDSEERRLVDSRPFQRLRYIHQLAFTYLVYPGATQRRFEHSLGVMDVAARIYDVATDPENVYRDSVRDLVPPKGDFNWSYWRRVLRMAAITHDVGHLPFSHAAEKVLLPKGMRHEHLSRDLILSRELKPVFEELKVDPRDVAKLAVGPKYFDSEFSEWESILYEMIGGNVFGADRIDYLLRDAYHAGVAYGRFDHSRLIETMRILPREDIQSQEPDLGVTLGGLQAAESLLWARYFMYTQLYFHPVRRIYDIHLKEFLQEWLPSGHFSTNLEDHLQMTDNEVLSGLWTAAAEPAQKGHIQAQRITGRRHFRMLYESNPIDRKVNLQSVELVYDAAREEFGDDAVRHDPYRSGAEAEEFPVYQRDESIASSVALSETLQNGPSFAVDYVFVDPDLREKAKAWLGTEKQRILAKGTAQ
ncbi:MAG TPA: HD domain-containing protein [Bryobacteraceae bacterium]|nr:HD domain-containing protein [Bryobacteraceae bacterium]